LKEDLKSYHKKHLKKGEQFIVVGFEDGDAQIKTPEIGRDWIFQKDFAKLDVTVGVACQPVNS